MGKRNRTAAERQAELDQIEKDYAGIKRMLLGGLIAVLILCGVLVFTRPGGYMVLVVVLLLIEGVGYQFLSRSLEKRRDERIAQLDAEDA